MKFEWITDWDTIWSDTFLERWHRWMETSENVHVFFHPAMVKAWVDTYMPLRDIRPIFCIATQGETTLFLPLVLWHKNWKNAFVRSIVPVGYSDFDYHDPIVTGNKNISWGQFWDEFFKEVEKKWENNFDTIDIDGIRQRSIGTSAHWQEIEACPYIELSSFSNSDEFLQSLKKNLRQDTKRRVRRMEENSNVQFEVFNPDDLETALETLPELLRHHILRWPNAYKAPNFHTNLIKVLLPIGLLHFSRIILDSKTISWRIGFIYRDRYYSYMPAFDIEYNQYSPGKVHLFYCIDDAIKRKIQVYDQLRGAELYKNEWTNTVDTVWSYYQTNNNKISKLKTKLNELKNAIKR
ncbi:MAG: GNAT family N-acetyltransferase [Sulfuricurvum sp.]|nr:GNAT family N-acetyltransferase [Sulfuricurvum sp.]